MQRRRHSPGHGAAGMKTERPKVRSKKMKMKPQKKKKKNTRNSPVTAERRAYARSMSGQTGSMASEHTRRGGVGSWTVAVQGCPSCGEAVGAVYLPWRGAVAATTGHLRAPRSSVGEPRIDS